MPGRHIAMLLLAAGLGACAEGGGVTGLPDAADAPPAEDGTAETADAECPPGYTRCGASCVDLNSSPDHCGACDAACPAGEVCNEGHCAGSCVTGLTDCGGACVDLQTDEAHCGSCGRTCGAAEECVDGGCVCVPSCTGRECGPDGCGGTCPPGCTGGAGCRADGTCECVPSCTGRECGPDGCGGTCPPGCSGGWICGAAGRCECAGTPCGSLCCYGGQVCTGGTCCTPACAGRECGPDGCGGSCGTCPSGWSCDAAGDCVCTPACTGRECGPDGCGGSCGSCSSGWGCNASGVCVFEGLTFEAESGSMGHVVGRAEADGWSANTAADGEGHLLYGPYTRDVPAGSRTATFRMMIDNNSADTLRVVNLDVHDFTTSTVLAQRGVRRNEFSGTMTYQDFAVSFTAPGGSHELEFRIYWYDYAYIRVDRVTVR
ncbi:MAG: hypothetical protein JXB32_16380 [Deltaproteobacteria bacterium]|nr:hypothetical protein [Deltaproteobacteria bacterium]